ncbi:MAG: hypothetical protein D6805_04255, partial [Planctomycetota bacterium]
PLHHGPLPPSTESPAETLTSEELQITFEPEKEAKETKLSIPSPSTSTDLQQNPSPAPPTKKFPSPLKSSKTKLDKNLRPKTKKHSKPAQKSSPLPWILATFLLLASAGAGFYFLQTQPSPKKKNTARSAKNTPKSSNSSSDKTKASPTPKTTQNHHPTPSSQSTSSNPTSSASNPKTTTSSSKSIQNPKLAQEKKEYENLKSMLQAYRQQPEHYPEIIKNLQDFLRTSTQPTYRQELEKQLQGYKKRLNHLAHAKYNSIFQKFQRFLSQKLYKSAEKYLQKAKNTFPLYLQNTNAYQKLLELYRKSRHLKQKAENEFQTALEKASLYAQLQPPKFQEAIQILNSTYRGYPDLEKKIDAAIQRIRKQQQKFQEKQRKIQERKRIKTLYESLKEYYIAVKDSYYPPINNREYSEALRLCQATQNYYPQFKERIKKDEQYIRLMKKFLEKAKKNASRRVGTTISSLRQGNFTLSGRLKDEGNWYTIGGRYVYFSKIHPTDLYRIFIQGENNETPQDLIALAAMLSWENYFQEAQKVFKKLRQKPSKFPIDLYEKMKFFQLYPVQEKAKAIYSRIQSTIEAQNWEQAHNYLEEIFQPRYKISFVFEENETELKRWKKLVQSKLASEATDYSPLQKKSFSLFTLPLDNQLWKILPHRSSWAPQGTNTWVANQKPGILLQTAIRFQKQLYPLKDLNHYKLSFELKIPLWNQRKTKALKLYLPYKRKRLTLVFEENKMYFEGYPKQWKTPNLTKWHKIILEIQNSQVLLTLLPKNSTKIASIQNLSLHPIPPSEQGIGFHHLWNYKRILETEDHTKIRNAKLHIP